MNLRILIIAFFFSQFAFAQSRGSIQIEPPADLGIVKALYSNKSLGFCAIKADDHAVCWGSIAAVPADLGAVREMSMDYEHSCAIDFNDNVRCWGEDYGPNMVIPIKAQKALSISVHSKDCVVGLDFKTFCWKYGKTFLLPDDYSHPVDISSAEGGVCAITADHSVKCFNFSPTWYQMVPPTEKAIKLDMDDWATGCILTNERTVVCFGRDNEQNQLTPLDLGSVKDLSVARGNACVIKADDTITCWKTWGPGTYPSVGTPITDKVTKVVNGLMSGCGILASDKSVKCWSDYQERIK